MSIDTLIPLHQRGDQRAAELRPIAPPRVLEHVFTPEQVDAIFTAAHRGPPRPLLVAKAFRSVEEIFAVTSGGAHGGATLDDFLAPMFRGELAEQSACFEEGVTEAFYNDKLMRLVRDYWQMPIVVPRNLNFNVAAPMKSSDPGHFDSPGFRGVSYTNTPVWLIKVMANSMLFRDYRLRLGSVVTWFWTGSEHGGFTYWPDGAEGSPQRVRSPMWNRGCLAENEMMFHRGESIGSADEWGLKGLTFNSQFDGVPGALGHWRVRNGDEVIARYATEDLRWMFHWTALVFPDRAAFRTFADHTDDLTHERICDTLIKDLRANGVKISAPSDPLNDEEFKRILIQSYSIGAPKNYPPEAPVAPLGR